MLFRQLGEIMIRSFFPHHVWPIIYLIARLYDFGYFNELLSLKFKWRLIVHIINFSKANNIVYYVETVKDGMRLNIDT